MKKRHKVERPNGPDLQRPNGLSGLDGPTVQQSERWLESTTRLVGTPVPKMPAPLTPRFFLLPFFFFLVPFFLGPFFRLLCRMTTSILRCAIY